MPTAVDVARQEIANKLGEYAPQHEGLRDFARLNIHPDTKLQVDALIAQYDRRTALLEAAEVALKALVDDGHPELAVRDVREVVYADLAENKTTIDAALLRFAPKAEASSLSFTEGPAESKV